MSGGAACDPEVVELAQGTESPVRAIKLLFDSKRPRLTVKESVPQGKSLKEDFEKVPPLFTDEACGVLVRIKDEAGTVDAKDTDWVLITFVPEDSTQGVKNVWAGAAESVRMAIPNSRLKGFNVIDKGAITWDAFLEKGTQLANLPIPGSFHPEKWYKAAAVPETKDYLSQQTMIRVRDPKASLDFYTKVLGLNLIMHSEFPQWGFNVYFVAYCPPEKVPTTHEERWDFCMKYPGCLEITWNYGSEKEAHPLYNTGNGDTTGTQDGQKLRGGFGHLGVTMPDVYVAFERFKALGVTITKSPNAGGMKGMGFVKDPDGYLVEILPQGPLVTQPVDCNGVTLENAPGYKDNSK